MIAFDTNVLTEILLDAPVFVERANAIPAAQQTVPIIVVEEMMRGRLNVIRQAEAGRAKLSLEGAYQFFQATFGDLRRVQILPFTSLAESYCRLWRQQGVRVATHDLRIAAICVAHAATLITRNRRDFAVIPDLVVEFWD